MPHNALTTPFSRTRSTLTSSSRRLAGSPIPLVVSAGPAASASFLPLSSVRVEAGETGLVQIATTDVFGNTCQRGGAGITASIVPIDVVGGGLKGSEGRPPLKYEYT